MDNLAKKIYYSDNNTKSIERLKELITLNETGQDEFIAFGLEAGCGKSIETTRIIKEYLKSGLIDRSFLVVKRFKDDIIEMSKEIPFSLPITSDNWKHLKSDLETIPKYTVVIISHERYIRLSLDPETRKYFEQNRHTLIIDELINFPIISFDEKRYKDMLYICPRNLEKELANICDPLFEKMTEFKRNKIKKCTFDICPNALIEFKEKVKANSWGKKNDEIQKFLRELEIIFSSKCLYNNERISTFDRNIWFWGLKNNIILDANVGIDARYKFANSPNIILDRQSRILDHGTTTFHKVNFNSSFSNIEKTKNYFDVITEQIKKYQKPHSKTLIVTKFDFIKRKTLEKYYLPNCAVTYFGNLIGKNDWRDYNQVWIINTPILPMEAYSLYWSMFSGKELRNRTLELINSKGASKFKNEDFEEIRMNCIISEIYQALKRINRDNSQTAEMFVVNNNDEIINGLISQMDGIRIGETISLDNIEYIHDKKSTRTERFIEVCRSLPPGTYSKKEIREETGIDANHFSQIFKDSKVQDLCKAKIITINQRNIIIS